MCPPTWLHQVPARQGLTVPHRKTAKLHKVEAFPAFRRHIAHNLEQQNGALSLLAECAEPQQYCWQAKVKALVNGHRQCRPTASQKEYIRFLWSGSISYVCNGSPSSYTRPFHFQGQQQCGWLLAEAECTSSSCMGKTLAEALRLTATRHVNSRCHFPHILHVKQALLHCDNNIIDFDDDLP